MARPGAVVESAEAPSAHHVLGVKQRRHTLGAPSAAGCLERLASASTATPVWLTRRPVPTVTAESSEPPTARTGNHEGRPRMAAEPEGRPAPIPSVDAHLEGLRPVEPTRPSFKTAPASLRVAFIALWSALAAWQVAHIVDALTPDGLTVGSGLSIAAGLIAIWLVSDGGKMLVRGRPMAKGYTVFLLFAAGISLAIWLAVDGYEPLSLVGVAGIVSVALLLLAVAATRTRGALIFFATRPGVMAQAQAAAAARDRAKKAEIRDGSWEDISRS